MSRRKRPPHFGTDKSLEDQFLASLERAMEGTEYWVVREYAATWAGKRKFRWDFWLALWPDGAPSQECLVEIQGGGPRGAHGSIAGRTRDSAKLALANFADKHCFMFTSPQVKSGEAAEIVAAWLRGHEAPACLTEPPRATKAARKAKRLARPAKKARLKRAA